MRTVTWTRSLAAKPRRNKYFSVFTEVGSWSSAKAEVRGTRKRRNPVSEAREQV